MEEENHAHSAYLTHQIAWTVKIAWGDILLLVVDTACEGNVTSGQWTQSWTQKAGELPSWAEQEHFRFGVGQATSRRCYQLLQPRDEQDCVLQVSAVEVSIPFLI